jgi:hypothetical protein
MIMEIIKLFKRFKLSNSVFTGCFKLDRNEFNSKISDKEIEYITTKKMVENLSNLIISKNQSSIVKTENIDCIEFRCQLLVLKIEDFKTVVEAAIQEMPYEAINKIKNGIQ